MAAGEASSSSRRKPHCFVLFLLWFVHDKTPDRWKNQVSCNFFRTWKKYVVNVYKICFYLVVFLYWSMTALLGPRFLKMKYCSSPHACVIDRSRGPCWGPNFDLCFLYSPTGKWKSTAISSRSTVDCVVKIYKGMAEITERKYSKRFSVKRFTLT